MKYNSYQLISELLITSEPTPNSDMLIVKPSLYIYIPKDQLESVKENGIKADENNLIHAFFTRIPESAPQFHDFLSNHIVSRIVLTKLKKIKDQKVEIRPINLNTQKTILEVDDIKKISKNVKHIQDTARNCKSPYDIPHAGIWMEKGYYPSFAIKFLDPESLSETGAVRKIWAKGVKLSLGSKAKEIGKAAAGYRRNTKHTMTGVRGFYRLLGQPEPKTRQDITRRSVGRLWDGAKSLSS